MIFYIIFFFEKMNKKEKKKKFTFILKNINPDNIDRKYGIKLQSNLLSNDNNQVKHVTKIEKLCINNNNKFFSYIDESTKNYKCLVSMYDIMNKPLPKSTNISCYWCKHKFSSVPLGCPIKYIPSEIVKKYISEITKDKYEIKKNISKNTRIYIEENIENIENITLKKKEYFQTDGIFCSFNCCIAFINNNKYNPLYCNSINLLSKMYCTYFNKQYMNIIPAPNWRLLLDFGGQLTIEEFRESFYKAEYNLLQEYITELPQMYSIGFLHQQEIKF